MEVREDLTLRNAELGRGVPASANLRAFGRFARTNGIQQSQAPDNIQRGLNIFCSRGHKLNFGEMRLEFSREI